jgi:glycosyltransferase involved in cell wall biosynthesis
MQPVDISVVSPVYQTEALIPQLVAELETELQRVTSNYEIILVEDGSTDESWRVIEEICRRNKNVRGLRLSRNFGQHYAISAGLSHARGRWVVVMDCDLQDRPSEISKLLKKTEEGYEIVLAHRTLRQDSFLKRASSRLFYGVLGWLTGMKQDPAVANFGVYSHKVIAAINSMPETIRYFPTMVRWVGFKIATVPVAHAARPHGGSSYSISKLLNLALDICLAYSDKPLRLVIGTGFAVSIIGFFFALFTLFQALRGDIAVLGYASLIVSIWTLSGLIIFIVGVVGLYVGKSFEGVKRRPPFIIAESTNSPG